MPRSDITSLIAIGLVARDGCHPDWAEAQAERLLQTHDREQISEWQSLEARYRPDPATLPGRDH